MFNLLKSRENIVFYFLAIFAGFSFLLSGSDNFDIILKLFLSHFATYCSGVLFILICLIKEVRNIHIRNNLIVRIGEKKFLGYQYLTLFIMFIFYIVSQYAVAFLLGEIKNISQLKIAVVALVMNIIIIFIDSIIINLVNFNIKSIAVFLLSILVNFTFHYGYCLNIISKIYIPGAFKSDWY